MAGKTVKSVFKPRRSYNRKNKRRNTKVSPSLKTAINRIVHGSQETKYRAQTLRNFGNSSVLTDFTGFTSAITGTGEIYSLIPAISMGDGSFARVGNVINPLKLRVHLNICTTQNKSTNTDWMVYAFFLECPQVKDIANSSAIPITQLLDNGAGSHVQFDGTSQTSLYRINTNVFKVIRVIKKRLIWNYDSSFTLPQDPSQNHHSVSLDIPVPKKYTYAQESAAYPSNHAPFFCLGFIDNTASGDTAPGATASVMVEGRSELWYKDA